MIEKSANLAPQTTPGLPAGFTYFGQFLDHDISFDSRGDREVHSHLPFELSKDQSVNQHSPVFNLEVIYGSNPVTDDDRIAEDVRPFLDNGLLPLMKIGRNRVSVTETRELLFDLLRHPDSLTAIIADPRSDGNLCWRRCTSYF
ncbi:MAG: hypothetical protein IPJ30_04640 [Acidobacteria bacterium]|nr:hypothetical protein [Acidobacteriota bacterium]